MQASPDAVAAEVKLREEEQADKKKDESVVLSAVEPTPLNMLSSIKTDDGWDSTVEWATSPLAFPEHC